MTRSVEVASFLKEFGRWVEQQPDIEAVALVGSYARDAATRDSDVDLIILTTAIVRYFQDPTWLSMWGQVEEYRVENWGRVESLRAFYKGGLEVEYNFSSASWAGLPVDAGTRRVVSAGMRIMFDPQGLLQTLQQEIGSGAILASNE